ncbi:hypothetical protein SAMN02745166_00059 [Prosthecobacter debontii]|uniref:Uncharacterized protein n=1 Tax=Prosthecobacter debontii TaxID=48467 RepID=A0A1T4WGE2_9BACT|nr:hypothetical protein [Prosthecobacter debontii]SKA75721.1 hypothetical protein SAMN02745166_00059 [Prosthecobacter debontii]
MSRLRKLLILAVVVTLSWGLYDGISRYRAHQDAARFAQTQKVMETRQDRATTLPGDEILKHYASPETRPEEDLDMLAHAFSNLMLLVKGDSPFHMGANEEFAAALRGKNRSHLRFVSDSHRAFNPNGQLLDRWGSPLYFHTVSQDRVDIRSAGPDGQMWTDDDLHRHYDGRFMKGEELNPPSLWRTESKPPKGK